MAERNAAVPPTRQMRFRIGVNLGDVMYDGTRAYGDGLNVAARVQALADPGGICVTALVREEVGARTSLVFEALGAQRLKNIPRPVRVFRIRYDEQGEQGATTHITPRDATRAWRRPVLIGLLVVALAGILGLGVRLDCAHDVAGKAINLGHRHRTDRRRQRIDLQRAGRISRRGARYLGGVAGKVLDSCQVVIGAHCQI